jgi:glycosyltransferase involved in cell wall biosynthesis
VRILVITEKFPYPLDTGGNVRTYHLIKGLAASNQVTLLAAAEEPVHPDGIAHMRQFCAEVRIVPVRRPTVLGEVGFLIESLVTGKPFVVIRRYRRELEQAVTHAFQGDIPGQANTEFSTDRSQVDAVYFNHLDAALYLPKVPSGVALFLDEHNVVTNQVRTTAASERNVVRRMILKWDAAKLPAYETDIANRMDRCLACSQVDADALVSMGALRRVVSVVPNGVDTAYFTPPKVRPSGEVELAFVGTLDYDPCDKALWYFVREILPLIRQQFPRAKFVAVGRNPSARLRSLAADDPNFVLTGRVDDIRPHLRRAHVFIVPLLSGSGTRLKILEAMAAGVPVVSTTIGAEGIAVNSGRHLWLSDEPEEFAGYVARVLLHPDEADAMRRCARELVMREYSWETAQKQLARALQREQFAR